MQGDGLQLGRWAPRGHNGVVSWCLKGVGWLLWGMIVGGCTRPAVVPPTLAIPQQPAPQRPAVVFIPRIDPWEGDAAIPRVPAPGIGETDWPADVPFKDWKYVVLHHTATDQGNVESIHAAHLQKKDKYGNPWQGIGYHFVIGNGRGMADGAIEPTFRWRQQLAGAHAGVNDFNQHGIGVVLVGDFEKQHPTLAQRQAVKRLVGTLSRRFEISADRVMGHDAVKATACPGRNFPMREVRASLVAFEEHRGQPLPPSTPLVLTSGTSRKDW
jgi:hypothetical protein